jgi:hypothetical protein
VRAGARRRLEHLCRYVLRPPVAQDALALTPEGHVLLRLRRPWRDGTRAIRFEPSELLEKLAAMIPRPRANLLIYHGACAPRGCCRESAARCPPAASAHPAPEAAGPPSDGSAGAPTTTGRAAPPPTGNIAPPAAPRGPPPSAAYVRPRHVAWAELLRRTFAIGVLACPDCGGRLRLVATIADRQVIEKILAHLGLPLAPPSPAPARSAEGLSDWPD